MICHCMHLQSAHRRGRCRSCPPKEAKHAFARLEGSSREACPRCDWLRSQKDEDLVLFWSLGITDEAKYGREVRTLALAMHAAEGHPA